MHLHVMSEHGIDSILRQDAVKGNIFLPELTTIISSDTSGDETREDDVDDERYDQEFKDKHIAPPMQCEVSRDVFSFLLH